MAPELASSLAQRPRSQDDQFSVSPLDGVRVDLHLRSLPRPPLQLIVALLAGGSSGIVARLLAEDLRTNLGQLVIVENRSGATGNIRA